MPPPDYSGTLYGKLSSKPDEYENNEDSFIKEPPNETEEESYKELNKKIYRPVRKVRKARQKAEKDLFEKDVPISTVSAVDAVDYEENKNENYRPENNFDEGKGLSLGAEDIFLAALLILMINLAYIGDFRAGGNYLISRENRLSLL